MRFLELPSLPKPRQDNSVPTVYAEAGTNKWKNLVPGGVRSHELKIEGLLLYQQSHSCMCLQLVIIAACDRGAAMRNAANKNVALSACAITAQQPAKADKPPSLTLT